MPVASIRTARSHARVPARLTPFVGRQADLERLLALLQDPSVRLVTLRGMGGVGKTALALELLTRLGDAFEHGAAFVPLAPLGSLDALLPALAQALDVRLPPSGDLQQALLEHLSELHLLLVLDNFDHLLDEAVLVRDMLLAAPRLKVLVTSREKLNLEAELLYNLDGLPLPLANEGPQASGQADSVALFLQRGRQVRPGFCLSPENSAAVVGLCRLVDGNPLGILLAASWVEHFPPGEILDQAAASLDFLTRRLRDVEARHSGLRALFESSYQRLDGGQKAVFRKLSIFRGGFDLPAARAVAAADLADLIALVDKSMLARDLESGRYESHALLQQYAREELAASGELAQTVAAHTAYYRDFVRLREPRMTSRLQAPALDEVQADLENLRQAWSEIIARRDFAAARLMMPGLYAFCDMRSRFIEGEAMFRQSAEGLAPASGQPAQGAWALALLSWYDMHSYIEHLDSYVELAGRARLCLEHLHAAGDAPGEAASLVLLGAIAQHEGDYEAAIPHFETAMRLYPGLADAYWVDMRIGLAHEAARAYDAAIRAFEACLARSLESGERVKQGWSHQNIGDCLRFQGRYAEAGVRLEQAGALFREIGTRDGVLWSTYSLSHVAFERGNREQALDLALESSHIARQIHSPSWILETANWLQRFEPGRPAAAAPAAPSGEALSERELEVLQLLKSDLSGPEIAERLVVSLNTVRFHTKHIYQKLGVNSRLEAIHRAHQLGL